MLAFLNANKTKITGALLTTLAFVQTNSALGTLLSPQAYAWTMFFVGLFVTFLGFLNNPGVPPKSPGESRQGGWARPLMLAFLLATSVSVMLTLSGCPASNPIQQAETFDQKALATYGSYVIVKEQAAKLYADPVTPPEVAESLKAANEAARGPFDLMYQSMVAYKQTQEALEFGTATEADLQRAAEALLTLYLEAGPALQKLEDAVDKVRK